MKIYKKIISLLTIGVLSATMMVGCGKGTDSTTVLNVYNVGDYIDESLISKFEEETGIKVLYETYDTATIRGKPEGGKSCPQTLFK